MEFSKLFMYIPGIVIFLVGSGQVQQGGGLLGKSGSVPGTVVSCDHVVRKDRKDRDVYNYYNVLVEFVNPVSGRRERQAVKSPTEYAASQEVRLLGAGTQQLRIGGVEGDALFPPIAQMIGGALLILLAFFQNDGQERRAMLCLTLILLGAGALLIYRYVRLRGRNLQELDAEIVEIYSRQLARETKILVGSKYTYYPVVRYTLNGKENLRRCAVNSSGEKSFKVGEHMKLYYDPERGTVTEAHAQIGVLIAGVVLLACGLAAAAGLIAALL